MSNQDLQEVSASANICLDYSQLNFCTNSNCHIIITHLNSFLSCFILIFLLLRCTAAKLPKEQTGQRNCCCYCRYTGPIYSSSKSDPRFLFSSFRTLAFDLNQHRRASQHGKRECVARRGNFAVAWLRHAL